jgi:hypothetical protein
MARPHFVSLLNFVAKRIVALLSKQYTEYLQSLIKFNAKTSLLVMRGADAPAYIKKLKSKDVIIIYEQFESFINQIV